MRVYTPEISWHNRLPALSLDISQTPDEPGHVYRVATGGNDCRVYIWLVDLGPSGGSSNPDIRIRAGLKRHQKSVGAVRFSGSNMLASGDDDGYIYLWKQNTEQDSQHSVDNNVFLNDDGFEDLELWQQHKVLRGHVEDICDLSWSKDGQYLLSGSVDNSAILWDTVKGTKVWCSDLTKGYVQGVAIDPHAQYMAAFSSDRALRLYNFSDKRRVHNIKRVNIKGNFKAFFCDDTVQTFCRRLEFSPDGQFLIAPTSRLVQREKKASSTGVEANHNNLKPIPQAGMDIEVININSSGSESSQKLPQVPPESNTDVELKHIPGNADEMQVEPDNQPQESEDSGKSKKPINVFLVFRRSSLNKPTHYYPTGREVAICVRFSPVVYKIWEGQTNFWDIPYRIVFAVATSRSVFIYDSQQPVPIGYVSQIHLARLTDLAWSSDGRLLMVSSYDGYSTLISFDDGEFGEIYTGPLIEPVVEPTVEEELATKKGQKRSKIPKESPQSVKQPRKEAKSPRLPTPPRRTVTLTTLWSNLKKNQE